jgi:hypothetical protein
MGLRDLFQGRVRRVLLANGREVVASAPDDAYAALALAAGQCVQVSLRKDAVMVLRPGGESVG